MPLIYALQFIERVLFPFHLLTDVSESILNVLPKVRKLHISVIIIKNLKLVNTIVQK